MADYMPVANVDPTTSSEHQSESNQSTSTSSLTNRGPSSPVRAQSKTPTITEKEDQPRTPKHRRAVTLTARVRSLLAALEDSWVIEIGAAILSAVCTVGICVLLQHFNGKPLVSWPYKIQPNSVISILATIAKSSLLLPVAECISQAKWIHFRGPHSLRAFQTLDAASRGPLGCVQALFHVWNTIALLGAFTTICVLAYDPLVQQVLSFEPHDYDVHDAIAQVPVTYNFTSGAFHPLTAESGRFQQWPYSSGPDFSIQQAINRGLYNMTMPAQYICQAPTCTYGPFVSLGVCSTCENVTSKIQPSCSIIDSYGFVACNYTTPAGLRIQSIDGASEDGGINTFFNWTSATPTSSDNSKCKIIDVATVKRQATDYSMNTPFEAFDCSVRWCAKAWSGASFSNSTFAEPPGVDWDVTSMGDYTGYNFASVQPDPNLNFSGSRDWQIDTLDWTKMIEYLGGSVFVYSEFDTSVASFANIFYNSSSVPQTMHALTDSLTYMVRASPQSTSVSGQARRTDVIFNVRWPWVVLPVLVVIVTNFLLAMTIWTCSHDKSPIWKSSVLALLYHGLADDAPDASVVKLSEMDALAEKTRVVLTGSTVDEFKLKTS